MSIIRPTMHRIFPLLAALLLLMPGCKPEEPEPFPSGTPDDDDATDDDDASTDDDDVAPPEIVVGEVVDAESGATLAGIDVVELGTEPPNSSTTGAEGEFQLTPEGWEPLQLFAPADGRLLSSVALNARTGAALGGFVQLQSWTMAQGAEWQQSTFGVEWGDGTGVLVIDLIGILPEAAAGVGASLSAVHGGGYVQDAEGLWYIAEAIPEGASSASIVFLGVTGGPTTISLTAPAGVNCRGAGSMEIFGDSTNVVPFQCTVAAGE